MNSNLLVPTRSRRNLSRRGRARARRTRGSVLILVVALLVLMALIGTAWISTTRVDRAAAIENSFSTQAELFMDGVTAMAQSGIAAASTDAGVLRGPNYSPSDGAVGSDFLSARLPVFLDEIATDYPPPTLPAWQTEPPVYEAGCVVKQGGTSGTYYVCLQTHRFDTTRGPGTAYWGSLGNYDLNAKEDPDRNPIFWPATTRILPANTKFENPLGGTVPYDDRRAIRVSAVQLPNGRWHPAFRVLDRVTGALGPAVMAADTDGDGLADAHYFKLPVGKVNGLDWYAAIRIVDNNSAVNANIGYEPAAAGTDGTVAHFPTDLNLRGLLIGQNAGEVDAQFFQLEHATVNDNPTDDLPTPPPNGTIVTNFSVPVNDLTNSARTRKDFAYNAAAVQQFLWMVRGRRLENPGYWAQGGSNAIHMKALPSTDQASLAYRGGTLMNPDAMNPNGSASSLIEQLLAPTLYWGADNHPFASGTNLNNAYQFDVGRRSSYPADESRAAFVDLFRRNFDWYGRWSPPNETPNDRSTYRNRRTLLTTFNPVSSGVPNKLVSRDAFDKNAIAPGRWRPTLSYHVGDSVRFPDANGIVYTCIGFAPTGNPNAQVPPGEVANPTSPARSAPNQVRVWEARPYEQFPTRASANAASFGQLMLAFYQTMAEPASLKMVPDPDPTKPPAANAPPKYQTPFKDAWRYEWTKPIGKFLDSPYYGMRFQAGVPGAPNGAYVFPPTVTKPDGTADTTSGPPDQHPLRMFRNVVRAVAGPTATAANAFDANTPRVMVDDMVTVRAAIAAVNAIDMRDGDDNVTFRDVNIGVTMQRPANPLDEFQFNGSRNAIARVRVYGHERQPFITEIYANNDFMGKDDKTGDGPNPNGYVAVELYNPYPVAIDIRFCKLATINRTPGVGSNLVVNDPLLSTGITQVPFLANAQSNMEQETDPWLVPAHGFLVLENYKAPGATPPTNVTPPAPQTVPTTEEPPAVFRPGATGLPVTGKITPVNPAAPQLLRNYSYVPNLGKVMDREMVLVRPLGADYPTGIKSYGKDLQVLRYIEPAGPLAPASAAVDMAPLDSYDFTGLPNPDPTGLTNASLRGPTATSARAWHYARAWAPTTSFGTTKAWRFVYPGRYDGYQTVTADASARRPRQQGTQEDGLPGLISWDPQNGQKDLWDRVPGNPLPDPGMSLAEQDIGASPNATYYPYEYAIQLTNSIGLFDGAVGPNPVRSATGNAYPFGGYGRNGDILQVPYIGSYRIKVTPFGHYPTNINVSGLPDQIGGGVGDAKYHTVLEMNSITMDAAFAEDTDPDNHFNPLAVVPARSVVLKNPISTPPEQIGRFTPSLEDLEIALAGTVQDATANPGVPGAAKQPLARTGKLVDARAPNGPWTGYDITIVDGPGKGQMRPIVGFSSGTFTVYPDWDEPLGPTSRYVVRRGTTWRDPTTGGRRATANKFWASRLFDYVTVDSPQDDHLPAADPASYARFFPTTPSMLPPQAISSTDPTVAPAISYGIDTNGGNDTVISGTGNLMDVNGFYNDCYLEYVTGPAAGQVRKIRSYTGNNRTITLYTKLLYNAPRKFDVFRIFGKNGEDLTGTQGLVNINTAPWPVLATIPFVDGNPNNINVQLAQAIAKYRDGDPSAGSAPGGPFRSIFDLYKVPLFFQTQAGVLTAGDPGAAQGDFTPGGGLADNVRFDFEEQYLMLNRISNMITTRSDSFTAYVLVQGWRGAGTATPELVVQRRRAFTADRTGMTPTNKDVPIQYLYND